MSAVRKIDLPEPALATPPVNVGPVGGHFPTAANDAVAALTISQRAVARLTARCQKVRGYFSRAGETRAEAAYRIGYDVGHAVKNAGHWLRHEAPAKIRAETPWALCCAGLTLAVKASLIAAGVLGTSGAGAFAASLAVGAVSTTFFRASRDRMYGSGAYQNMAPARQGSLAGHMWHGLKLTGLFAYHAAGAAFVDNVFSQGAFCKKVGLNMLMGGCMAEIMQCTGASEVMGRMIHRAMPAVANFLMPTAQGSELDGLTYGPKAAVEFQGGAHHSSAITDAGQPAGAQRTNTMDRSPPTQPKVHIKEPQRDIGRDLRESGQPHRHHQETGRVRATYKVVGQPKSGFAHTGEPAVATSPVGRYDLNKPIKLASLDGRGGGGTNSHTSAAAKAVAAAPPPAPKPQVAVSTQPSSAPKPHVAVSAPPPPSAAPLAEPKVIAECNVSAATGVDGITNPDNVCSPLPAKLETEQAVRINYPPDTGIPPALVTSNQPMDGPELRSTVGEFLQNGHRFVEAFNRISRGLASAARHMLPQQPAMAIR